MGEPNSLLQTYGPAPLAYYNTSDEWSLRQINAEQALVTQCMTAAGFSYTAPPPDITTIGGTDWDDFLGLTDMAQASSIAYRSPARVELDKNPQAAQEKEAEAQNQNSDPAYLTALYGAATARIMQGLPADSSLSDDQGCLTQADQRLTPPGAKPDMEIQGESWKAAKAKAQADPAVLADVEKWRSCMAQAGYQLTSIPLPNGDAEITPEAIAQAQADVTCKNSSGLIDLYIKTLYAAERDQINQRKAEFDAYEAYHEASDRLAADVLANG